MSTMKKKLSIVILAIAVAALWVAPAFAAQGQITEVNPSGIGTTNIASENNQASGNADDPDANRNGNAGNNDAADGAIIEAGNWPNQEPTHSPGGSLN